MSSSLTKEEEEKRHILEVLPILLKEDAQFRNALYEILGEVFTKKDEFSELKNIVKDIGIKVGELVEAQKKTDITIKELVEAQKRTDITVKELVVAQKELAEAQKKTDIAIRELTEAQKDLLQAQKRTEEGLKKTRVELGGLSRSVAYSLENEAYRMLPKILKENYDIEVINKFVRREINGREINILGEGKKEGRDVVIVGEAKLRFDERDIEIFEELNQKVPLVRQEDKEIIKILVAHFATDGFIEMAKKEDIIVIQSFEW